MSAAARAESACSRFVLLNVVLVTVLFSSVLLSNVLLVLVLTVLLPNVLFLQLLFLVVVDLLILDVDLSARGGVLVVQLAPTMPSSSSTSKAAPSRSASPRRRARFERPTVPPNCVQILATDLDRFGRVPWWSWARIIQDFRVAWYAGDEREGREGWAGQDRREGEGRGPPRTGGPIGAAFQLFQLSCPQERAPIGAAVQLCSSPATRSQPPTDVPCLLVLQ